jgi:hypothetical protein
MKTLILLRGVSGSGKSTFAEFLAEFLNGKAISADDYFINETGKYEFIEANVGKAHKWCQESTENTLNGGDYHVVIVHNTSVTNHEVELYKDIAEKCDAQFYSLVVENRHGGQNVHGVSNEKTESQALRLLNNLKLLDGLNYQAVKAKPRDYSKLEVIEYLRQFPSLGDGLEQLSKEYDINSKTLNGKILLKYGVGADKTPVIVRECRGLILSEKDLSIVSIPFEKFGNYLESYAHNDINWDTAKIVEKLDGSCFVLYYDQINEKWTVQTLGQIEAEEMIAGWGKEELGLTWAELFWNTFEKYADVSILNDVDKNYSYVFELCSPYNKVVVRHEVSKLVFLGMRNKKTLQEAEPETSLLYSLFDKPEVYNFKDLKEIKRICTEVLTDQEEGFVVIDGFKRTKFKSLRYVQEHYQSTVVTLHSLVGVVIDNEGEEYLSIFPEFKGVIDAIYSEFKRLGDEIDHLISSTKSKMIDKDSAKEFAELVREYPNKYLIGFAFEIFNGHQKDGYSALTWYSRPEWKTKIVRKFIDNSNIKSLVTFNQETASLKG